MAKEPPNTPSKGDRCRKRGQSGMVGIVEKVDPIEVGWNWCTVLWDNGRHEMCHRFELETVEQ